MMKTWMIWALAAVLLLAAVATSAQAFGWSVVRAKVRRDFPEVPRITTSALAAWLADNTRPAPLLLDVRTAAEYEVSHLRNAERVEPNAAPDVVTAGKDQPIVTYCSVGYRSGAFAQRLRAAGYTNVSNLEGSIFAWANEGRPLVKEGAPATTVHPFNRVWGFLLRRERRADLSTVSASAK